MVNVELVTVTNDKQRLLLDTIVRNNHSYVPNTNTVGRHIDYLIYVGTECVGMIGCGSATYPPCKDVLNYLNISKNEYKERFN